MDLIRLSQRPELAEKAALWFSSKWGVPIQAYRDSMAACVRSGDIPQWYMVLSPDGGIAAGAGIIENDFHDRPDLRPNLCALFVEPPFRRQGLARLLLDQARQDMARIGVERLYLVTDHTDFYERCGWTFYTMVNDPEGLPERMYTARTR